MLDAARRLRTLRGSSPLNEVCFGYRCVTLADEAALANAQVGYAVDPRGEDLTGEAPGDWRREWLVVGTDDDVGDPLFVDTADDAWPVFMAAHGEGDWEPVRVADSFASFLHALRVVQAVARGREHPEALAQNPLPTRERERALQEIAGLNPAAGVDYWQDWLEQE